MTEVLIVIPARYDSSRLPGKPLKKIFGIEMIKRVADIAAYVSRQYDNCSYVVATDDDRIERFCSENSIPSVMTSKTCNSGTDRSWDAVKNMDGKPEFVLNLQGDNPLCPPWFITGLINDWLNGRKKGVYTAYVPLSWEELNTLKEIKKTTPYSGTTVQIDRKGYALTFSKGILPVLRKEKELRDKFSMSPVKRHIGLYGYTYSALESFFKWDTGVYEECEGLEQMRFLENSIPIKMVEVNYNGRIGMSGVDSPEDIGRAEEIIKTCGEFHFNGQ